VRDSSPPSRIILPLCSTMRAAIRSHDLVDGAVMSKRGRAGRGREVSFAFPAPASSSILTVAAVITRLTRVGGPLRRAGVGAKAVIH
jgi:hypothetical protein